MNGRGPWKLRGFEGHLEDWIAFENPDDGLRNTAINWVLSRIDDPFSGARAEIGFPGLWYAVIPGSIHAGSQVVACSFWIRLDEHEVRCDQFASLSYPA